MAIVGFTHTALAQQVNTAPGAPRALNDDLVLPQQLSLFYAGKIAPKVGAFIQLTYSGPEDHLGIDNTDIRFAHTVDVGGKPLILGVTLNNNPTVTDLWNSTPAWGVPFTGSASAPTPGASTLVEGRMAQAVAGGSVYGFFNGLVYGEVALYRSAPLGVSLPHDASTGATNIIDGVMPYWRVAVEKGFGNSSLSVGAFGLSGTLLPGGKSTDTSTDPPTDTLHALVAPGDRYTDIAVDAQYQYIGTSHVVTAVATYIHEDRQLTASQAFGAADNVAGELHSFKTSVSYLYDRLVGGRVIAATTRGSSDATLYGGQGPRSTTLSGEVFYQPWQNARVALQYTNYVEFNGAALNYDGAGANAADNNTLYAYVWVAF